MGVTFKIMLFQQKSLLVLFFFAYITYKNIYFFSKLIIIISMNVFCFKLQKWKLVVFPFWIVYDTCDSCLFVEIWMRHFMLANKKNIHLTELSLIFISYLYNTYFTPSLYAALIFQLVKVFAPKHEFISLQPVIN